MKNIVLMDGAVGTSLWEKATDKVPVWRYNIENPKIVAELQREYLDAGAQIILADTFAANGVEVHRESPYSVEEVVGTAVKIAKDTINGKAKVGLAIGPLTGLLAPFGKISLQTAKDLFEEQIGAGMAEKPDVVYIQTFMDLVMLKIAVQAANHYDVPVLCSMSFMGGGKGGRAASDVKKGRVAHTMMGNSVKDILEGLKDCRVDGVGINCSMGPVEAMPVLEEFKAATDMPLVFKPNAGKPTVAQDGTMGASFDIETFANDVLPAVDKGATYIGGCCGSNAAYIKRLGEKIREKLEAEG
ncbi:MAG: homocysteine S-methyltransferase family protein [Synergistes sp.]|nr:homocysteine S-methyltransferase family protein [Synergistes sp.]